MTIGDHCVCPNLTKAGEKRRGECMSKTGRKTRRQHQYHTYAPSLRRRPQHLPFVKLNVKQSNLSPSSIFVKLDVQKGQTFQGELNIKRSKCLPPHHLLVKLDVQKGETFLVELNIKWSKCLPLVKLEENFQRGWWWLVPGIGLLGEIEK